MKDHTFSVPCMIITDFVMEARPFFESQIKRKDSTWYLLSKILVLQQSAVGRSLVGSSHCAYQQKPPEDCKHESTGAADCNDEGVFAVLQATVQVHAEEASNHHSEAAGKSSKLNEHCYLH